MERVRMFSISLAAASDNLYIETVPGLYTLPYIFDTSIRFTTVLAGDQRLDQYFTPVLIRLVTADEVAYIVAGIAVVAGTDLVFYPRLHEVG